MEITLVPGIDGGPTRFDMTLDDGSKLSDHLAKVFPYVDGPIPIPPAPAAKINIDAINAIIDVASARVMARVMEQLARGGAVARRLRGY